MRTVRNFLFGIAALLLFGGLFLLTPEAVRADVVINETNFPDPIFRAWISENCNTDGNKETLSADEIAAVTDMDVANLYMNGEYDAEEDEYEQVYLHDLTGISFFTELTSLDCSYNQLTGLDVSNNTALTSLDCSGNQLTGLDVSKNTALTRLECDNNQLTGLDVSKNTALEELHCSDNQLTGLDVSKNTALEELHCSDNQLTGLDVSQNTALTRLECDNNQLTGLDVSKNTNLGVLDCSCNKMSTLTLKNTGDFYTIGTIDCHNNYLTVLNLGNLNTDELDCSGNELTSLILCENGLRELDCHSNRLTSLDLKNNIGLSDLYCWNNLFTELDVSVVSDLDNLRYDMIKGEHDTLYNNGAHGVTLNKEAKKLNYSSYPGVELDRWHFPDENFRKLVQYLFDKTGDWYLSADEIEAAKALDISGASAAEITDLTGIEHLPSLQELYINAGNLTSLDLSRNTSLVKVDIDLWPHYQTARPVRLTALSVSGCSLLAELNCHGPLDPSEGGLESLTLDGCTSLQKLYCRGNWLTSLDVSNCTNLTELDCSDNPLTALDVSNCTELQKLDCWENRLTALNVTKNTKLQRLSCGNSTAEGEGNHFSLLDVRNNTELTELFCHNIGITTLDISKNTKLESLSCGGNSIGSLNVSILPALKDLYCDSCNLSTLDVSQNPELTSLYCSDNNLSVLDVSQNPELTSLYCSDNNLSVLNVGNNTKLQRLFCGNGTAEGEGNHFSLDVRNNTELTELDCSGLNLKNLDLSKNNKLTDLGCDRNSLDSLNVKNLKWLTSLDCQCNSLAELDITENNALTDLRVARNQLTELNVSRNPLLRSLVAGGNLISSIDVSGITDLDSLWSDGTIDFEKRLLLFDVPGLIPVTGITLNKTAVTLAVGGTETLRATITPSDATYKTVRWKSLNEAYATVDSSGKVTGIAPGSVLITASSSNSGISATCRVTVTAGGSTPTPEPNPNPDPTSDPDPDPTPEEKKPGADTVADEVKQEAESAPVTIGGENVTAKVETTYEDAVDYTGKKIAPKSLLKAKADLTDVASKFTTKKKYDPIDLLKATFVSGDKTVGEASFYTKITFDEKKAKKAGMTKKEIKEVKALVKAMNVAAKKNPCKFKIVPLSLSDSKVTVKAAWKKNGTIKKVTSVKVKATVNGKSKTFTLKKADYDYVIADADAKKIRITGKGNFAGEAEVVTK